MKIQKVEFGSIVINGEDYGNNDIIMFADSIEKKEKSHKITREDFEYLLMKQPEAVVLSTGFNNVVKIDESVKKTADNEGIELFVLKTPDAVKKFKEFSRKKKRVIALIHPTC